MANWLKKKSEGPDIRDTLFGDMPLAVWAGQAQNNGEPWRGFARAKEYIEAGQPQQAIDELKEISETADFESRHYLQAWHSLNELGVSPPEHQSKEVYGVVVEVAMQGGLDIVAAYADHTARYFNFSGAAIIWENPDDSIINVVDALLDAGRNIIHNIGPWEGTRPPAPPNGQARINILTPSGLHFGQAPLNALANDGMAGPIINAASNLMQALIQKTE
jgi:hypothetical protein